MTGASRPSGDEAVSLIDRLRSRKVVQCAIAYLAGAWVVLQVVDVVGEPWGWSSGAGRALTVVLGVGLLVVLTLAWYHGDRGRQVVSGVELGILAVLLAIGGLLITVLPEGIVDEVASGAGFDPGGGPDAPPWVFDDDRPSIAVLPFEDLNDGPGSRTFVDGLHNDVLTRLQKVGSLRVTGRTSVLGYRESPPDVRRIGRELQVTTVLAGAVQRTPERVRVSVALIGTRDESQLWAEVYDTTLTAENVFAVQGALAEAIAEKLDARVTAAERARLSGGGTGSLRALDLFDQAAVMQRWQIERGENEQRTRLLEQAVRLDPEFREARAALAHTIASRPRAGFPLEWADSGLALALEAVAVDPESSTAHVALGVAHRALGGLDDALAANRRALELAPNDAEAMTEVARLLSLSGSCDAALYWAVRATRSDPRNTTPQIAAAMANMCLGRWNDAQLWHGRTLEIDPGNQLARARFTSVEAYRDVPAAVRMAHQWLAEAPADPLALYEVFYTDLIAGEPEALVHGEALIRTALAPQILAYVQTHVAGQLLQTGQTERAGALLAEAEQYYQSEISASDTVAERDLLPEIETAPSRGRWELGVIRALQGRTEEALATLSRAVDDGWIQSTIVSRRKTEFPGLESLWDDPRFQAILDRMQERQSVMRERVEVAAEALRPSTGGGRP